MRQHDPWMKFYPVEWRGDPRLRLCSLAARGLWIEMCCIMHEADPYGHLIIADQAVADHELAALVGRMPDEVSAALAELESKGVFSRTKAGLIYSRRMVRMEKKARIARENGKLGGNPNLRKETANKPSDNQTPNPILEARSQKLDKKGTPSESPVDAKPRPDPGARSRAETNAAKKMMEIWNEVTAGTLPSAERLTKDRRQKLIARAKDTFDGKTSEWRKFCERVMASAFLRGEKGRESWTGATLDWVIGPKNCTKIIEGHYDDDRGRTNGAGRHDDGTDPELSTPYGRALLAWNKGGKQGPRPKREDFANG